MTNKKIVSPILFESYIPIIRHFLPMHNMHALLSGKVFTLNAIEKYIPKNIRKMKIFDFAHRLITTFVCKSFDRLFLVYFMFDVFISINFGFDRVIFLNQKNVTLYDDGGQWLFTIIIYLYRWEIALKNYKYKC